MGTFGLGGGFAIRKGLGEWDDAFFFPSLFFLSSRVEKEGGGDETETDEFWGLHSDAQGYPKESFG